MINDNEIAEALECCSNNKCSFCPLNGQELCMHTLTLNAFCLVKRQQAEIERLEKTIKLIK